MKTTAIKPVKPLNPKSPDSKYTGSEPLWTVQPELENRNSALIGAFSWYNYHYDKKAAKEFIIDWLTRNERTKDAKDFARVPDTAIKYQPGWLARMGTVGLILNDHELRIVNDSISELINSQKLVKEVVKDPTKVDVYKPNIQDRLREKVSEAAGELEGLFDEFVADGSRMSASYKPISLLRSMNVAPQMVNDIAEIWKKKAGEFEEVLVGKDSQLVEGYSNFTKIQLKNLIKFAEQVIADCGSYVQIKKVERKPRKSKPISPEKITSKFKYLKEFPELKLKSVPVTELVGASEAWIYDTKKRKLIHVMSDPHIGNFTVKGSSIIGFDSTTSTQKTLRKPAEQIKGLLSGGLPAARKYFKDIKSTDTKFNGRSNENLILLKVK